MQATIAADEHEINTMERALEVIQDDAYYQTVVGRYIDNLPDEDVAKLIPCDTSTVWRNRKRLVQRGRPQIRACNLPVQKLCNGQVQFICGILFHNERV